jgi:ribosomal protein S18 acetylase RimI-like enzyme
VGYLQLNKEEAQTESNMTNSLEIERIYVKTSFHGEGIGYFLINEAKKIAQEKGLKFIWLAVWENNPKAIDFYKRNGFQAFGMKTFWFADDPQNDIMMRFDF